MFQALASFALSALSSALSPVRCLSLSHSLSLGFADSLAGLGLDSLALGYVTTVDVGVSSVSVSVSKFSRFDTNIKKTTSNCALRILTVFVSLSVSECLCVCVCICVCVRKILKANTIRLHFSTACTSTKYSQCTQMPKIL